MFIVFENNPQLFKVEDQFHLFNDAEQASRYAINRGLSSPYFKSYKDLENLVDQPGKAVTGGSNVAAQITLANVAPVDFNQLMEDKRNAQAEMIVELQSQLVAAQKSGADTDASLDAANKKVADLTAQLAAATAKKAAKADKPADPAPAATPDAAPAAPAAPATK